MKRGPVGTTFTERIYRLWVSVRDRQRESGSRGLLRELLLLLRQVYEFNARYRRWVARYDTLSDADRNRIRAQVESMAYRPTFSIVMPVFNSSEQWLNQAIASVERQLYPDWELCIADDASTEDCVWPLLQQHAERHSRIKCVRRDSNGHISAASNSALQLATGEFVVLLDHDDELSEHALFLIAEELQAFPDAQIIYSDEDKIDQYGRRYEPFLKPDWSPCLARSLHYVSHLAVYRKALVCKVGGFREGYEGCQDYDILLRCSEHVEPEQIRHIPHVLYHWRAVPGSLASSSEAKPYVYETVIRVLHEHLTRTGRRGRVERGLMPWAFRVRPVSDQQWPGVGLVVTGVQGYQHRASLIDSLIAATDYSDLELLLDVEPGQDGSSVTNHESATVVGIPRKAGSTDLNSIALQVQAASKPVICFVSADVEFQDPGWLRELVLLALDPEVGVVGGRILTSSGETEHCGYIIGTDRTLTSPFRGYRADFVAPYASINTVRNCSAVSAQCLVMRSSLFEELKGFDETCADFEQAGIEFCFRAREAGYQIVWTPFATAQIRRGASSDRRIPQVLHHVDNQRTENYYSPNLAPDASSCRLSWPPRVSTSWT